MTTLNYDANGFIVGINRMKDGIDNVHDDTQEIIQILKSQNQISNTRMRELTRAVKSANYRSESQASASTSRDRSNSLDRQPRISSSASTDNLIASSDNSTSQTISRPTVSRDSENAADRNRSLPLSDNAGSDAPIDSSASARRQRDANGRFISDGSDSKRGFGLSGLSGIGRSDVSGVDPLVDSLREAKDLLSPIGRAGKLAGRAAKFSWSKFKSMKRREPLSNDETRHNRENEKLLDKIWKAIKKQGGGGSGGGGLLGGFLPGGGGRNRNGRGGRGGRILGGAKNLLKKIGGIKGLGIIGTVLGAGSLAMDWGGMDHKEKTKGVGGLAGAGAGAMAGGAAGAAIGSVVPVIGTAIGGVVGALAGAWIGSDAGEALGEVASPHIEKWTDSIRSFNLAKKMDDTWNKGVKPFFASLKEIGSATKSWFSEKYDGLKSFFSGGGSEGGDVSAGVTQKANKAADLITKNALTKSSGYCAKFVRQGLQEAGYDLKIMGDAKNYNNGAMQDAGFSVIDSQSAPQKGDVMVMPAQGSHGAGHMQIYNGQQWVSDFKQNSKNPWNDVATENLKYTMYRDQKGAMTSGGKISHGKGNSAKTKQAMDYFISQGWTKEQAAGIVGNLHKESGGFRDDVIQGKASGRGDGGKAIGIAQWHASRQQDFKNKFGRSIVGASFEDQLAFVQHELTNGKEQSAGSKLKKATSASQAGAIVSQFYERPADVEGEKNKRGRIATDISKNHGNTNYNASTRTNANIAKESAGAPLLSSQGYAPANLPTSPMLKIPEAIKIKERLDSGGSNKPIMLQTSNDTINQNLSDRGLAHAVTGGFGQDRMWG